MHFKLHITGGLKQSFFQSGLLLRAQLHCEEKKFKQKIAYADKLGIPYVVFLGEDEIAQGVCSVKDLRTGQQVSLSPDEAVELIRKGISELNKGSVILEK